MNDGTTEQSELMNMIRYYADHLLNEEDPERTAGYFLAQCINKYLYLEIEETMEANDDRT